MAFSNELVALLEAGLSLVEAIDALTEKERDESVRHLLEGLRRRLYEGQSLSVALGEFPGSFPTLYVATVRASERSGAIAEALRRFVAYQQQIDLLKKRLINASIYPAVLLAAGTLVVLFLVAYVVPRFSGIYEEIGGELPFASKMLMQWGRLLDAHGLAVLAGFVACVALAGYGVRAARPSRRGRPPVRAHPDGRLPDRALPAGAPVPHGRHAPARRPAGRDRVRDDARACSPRPRGRGSRPPRARCARDGR